MPNITITMNQLDSYGDGWNDAYVRIYDSGGAEVAAHTLEAGASGSDVFQLEDNASYTWSFGGGNWVSEASFTLVDENGVQLAAAAGQSAGGTLGNGQTETGSFDLGTPVASEFLSTHSSELGEFSALSSQITLPETYTINIWVKNVTLPDQEWSNLYQQLSGYNYILDANYGAIGAGTGPTRLAVSASDPLLVADTFHLVTCVFDGTTIEYYVNGVSIGSTVPGNKAPTVIDVVNGPGGQDFAAVVKDLRLYSMIATAQQVLDSYSTEGKFADPDYVSEEADDSAPPVDGGGDEAEGAPEYSFYLVPTVDSEPASDYDGDGHSPDSLGVFIQCSGGFDVYVKSEGSWAHHDSAFDTCSMLAADCGDGVLVYSTGGSQAYAWSRSSVMTDSHEDDDDLVDKLFMDSENVFDISSTEHTVSEQNPIEFPGETCQFAQVLESGRVSYEYSVTISQDSVVVTPPSGKDGQEIEIRLFL